MQLLWHSLKVITRGQSKGPRSIRCLVLCNWINENSWSEAYVVLVQL